MDAIQAGTVVFGGASGLGEAAASPPQAPTWWSQT